MFLFQNQPREHGEGDETMNAPRVIEGHVTAKGHRYALVVVALIISLWISSSLALSMPQSGTAVVQTIFVFYGAWRL